MEYTEKQLNLFKEYTRHVISLEAMYHQTKGTITKIMVDKDIRRLQQHYLSEIINTG